MTTIHTKKCSKCGLEKSLSEYSKKRKGHVGHCKPCQAQYSRDWYLRNKEHDMAKVHNYRKERYRQNRMVIDELKSKPCADCKQSFPPYVMDFDHQRDKEILISQMARDYAVETILEETDKCELVCANCHRMRTFSTHARAGS